MKFYEFYYKSRLIRAILHSIASPMHTCCCDRSWRLVGAPTTLIWVRNRFYAIVYVQNERKISHCATQEQSVGKFRPVVENHSTAHVNSIFKSYYWQPISLQTGFTTCPFSVFPVFPVFPFFSLLVPHSRTTCYRTALSLRRAHPC